MTIDSPSDNASNRRSEHRLDEHVTIFVERYAAEFDNAQAASIMICDSVDISANGVQVKMDQPLPIGTILRLCAQFSGGRASLYLVGEVKWQREENGQYCIGFALFESEQTDIVAWKELVAGQL